MSTTSLDETPIADVLVPIVDAPAIAAAAPQTEPAPAEARPAEPGVKTFRGRTLEELLPQIREQLGSDAIVVRQRDGLMGGVGGFFQQRFVEVDAKAGGPRIDVYDEEPPPPPESFAALLADAEVDADPIVTAAAFAPPVGDSQPPALPEPAPAEGGPRIAVAPTDPDSRSSTEPLDAQAAPAATLAAELPAASEPALLDAQTAVALTLTAELTDAGTSHAFAERLIQDAEAHELPFAQGDRRVAVRRALARRIPTAMPYRAGGLAVAFAGPGSTSCADALASAYKSMGRDARAVATLDQARARIERGAPDQLIALDLPPIAERTEVAALAERVRAIQLDELLMVLPADLDLPSARALHERLAPLAPTGIALACGPGSVPVAALELACTTRLPLAYVLDGAIAPADPASLAERLLP